MASEIFLTSFICSSMILIGLSLGFALIRVTEKA